MGGKSTKPQTSSGTSSSNTKGTNTNKFSNTQTNTVTGPHWAMDAGRDAASGIGGIAQRFAEDYGMPDYQDAWAMARGVANDPNGAIANAQDYYNRVLAGDYLYGGDAFNAAVDAAFRQGMPSVLSAFGGGGRSDGGLAKAALAQAFADPFAAQYGQERGLQHQTAQLAPGMALLPSSILEGIAGAQDQRAMQEGNLFGQWSASTLPFLGSTTTQKGKSTAKTKSKTSGTTSSVVHPAEQGGNPLMSGLGGALTGAKLMGMIPGAQPFAPVGALAGGLLGGIGSL